MKEINTAKMRQACMITGDPEISKRSPHPEPYLTKSEVRLRVAKSGRNIDKQALRLNPKGRFHAGSRYYRTLFQNLDRRFALAG